MAFPDELPGQGEADGAKPVSRKRGVDLGKLEHQEAD